MHRVRAQTERLGDTRSYTFVQGRRGQFTETRRTFTELDLEARAIAAWLGERRMADQAALLLYPAGLAFLDAFLGCLYSRVVAVPSPLPQTDPRALERAEGIIKDADVRLVLTDAASRPMLAEWLRSVGLDGRVECVATDEGPLADPAAWTMPRMDAGTLAYMQYTSGSTSEPRGVMLRHSNILHNEDSIYLALGAPLVGTGVGWLPHYHDMGLIGMLLQPVHSGGDLAFASPIDFVMRPALWLEMIDRYRAEYTVAPNFAYEWCLARVTDAQLAGLDLSSLRFAMNGAEPVRAETLRRVDERFGPAGWSPTVWAPGYGMAEATLLITCTPVGTGAVVGRFDPAELERHRAVPAEDGVELVASGRTDRMTVEIVDPETAEPLPEGHVGEIWVRGESVAQGYWQREEATRETFGARTAGGGGPYLRTGDLGFLRGGDLFVTGRIKDLIIVNGRNLYPQDIEETARGVHPAAGAVAAFGLDTGAEHVVVVQEVRPSRLGERTPAGLAAEVRAEIARAHAVSSVNVVLVERGGVSKTTSGKLQRRRTRQALLDGALPIVHAELSPGVRDLLGAGSPGVLGRDGHGERAGTHGPGPRVDEGA
ncbi:fatty acyl-AMP ligase [Bailinhaonella thermotolerans]|uniref:fatty acyl-AMP ligase n=1 Tax=Bailinhaonella thermotolerans TaxID=1070861 RepID=UPI00192A5B1F|nr:fatty acyl-AMP ligase [Bailinhaonella thermotolerans]